MSDTLVKEPTFEVTLEGSGRQFKARKNESVLNAALRQGVMLPYSCKNGTCASCKGRVVSGAIHYPANPPMALSACEQADGEALFCQAAACSDLVIQAREIEAVRDIPVRMMPARVIEKSYLADNVARLTLKLPKAMRMQFLAGQYIDILLPGGKRRAFSIASDPVHEDELELHIRHVDGGDFTGYVFHEMPEKAILRLEGPLGTFFVRHNRPERPMIMMAGGTGFAPLKSMVEYLLRKRSQRPISLFWGARTADELYQVDLARSWARDHDHIEFIPVLSEPEPGSRWSGATGFVHEAVLDHYDDLSPFDVYMSGPPMMIDAARHRFLERGLPENRLFYDSFEFGADVPVDVLAEPH